MRVSETQGTRSVENTSRLLRAFLVLAAWGSQILLAGCQSQSDVVKQIAGPEYTATLFKRLGGVPSRGATMVSIRLNSLSVSDSDTHGEVVLAVSGDKAVEMKWIDAKHLAMSCNACAAGEVNLEVVKAGEVFLTYDANLRVGQ